MKRWLVALLALLAVSWLTVAQAEVAVPVLKSRVTDLTATLTPAQAADIEQQLLALEQRKGSQLAVLIVPTTQPEAIEQYSLRVVEAWKLGRKGVDDGALLIIAKNDHTLRIEVGYGLEGVIPDAIAKRVIAETIVPYFKQNDYPGGIQAGVNQLVKLIDGEPLPPVKPQPSGTIGSNPMGSLFIVVIIAAVVGQVLSAVLGRFAGSGLTAAVVGGLGWFALGSALMAGLAALVVFIAVFSGINLVGLLGAFGGGRSGGSGGFGGGGGGFGGGGASGRW